MRVSERGQITIPKALREHFGLDANVEADVTPTQDGLLIRKRDVGRHPVDQVYGIITMPVSVDEYMGEIRGRRLAS